MNILAAAMQAQGPRARQEDAVLCEPAEGVFGVFDGLGGHDDGDKNSAGAARLLLSAWREAGRPLVPGKLDEAWSNAREALEAEVCDGVDNDCDGSTDEDEDDLPLMADCYNGDPETRDVGPCMGGFRTCVAGTFGRCEGEVIPEDEVCDGRDNDCDGVPDDGNPAGGQVCSTGLLGVCARGQTLCGSDGAECIAESQPSEEVCDGLDNDCDGQVDEDAQGNILERACYAGPEGTLDVGLCVAGRQICANGDFGGCVGQALPQAEVCDGFDNDCDGQTDDGNPGGGVACSTGQPGACAAGLTACQGGRTVCVPTGAASDEVRDGDTTATVGWLVGDGLLVMHAGDCSVLRYRNGEVVNLVERHGFGHVVTNTFRRRSSTSGYPDIERVHLAAGDLVIFATDGLEVLTHDAIAALLAALSPGPDLPERAASLLVNAAIASDTRDNVSVVVLAVA